MNKTKERLMRHLSVSVGAFLGLTFGLQAGAQDLELASEQAAIAGIIDDGSEGQPKPSEADGATAVYIVQLSHDAVATYEGGVAGMAATANTMTGAKMLDSNSPAAVAYAGFLSDAQDAFIEHCEDAFGHAIEVPFKYQHALNGVAMRLTKDEAAAVANAPGVASVQKERMEVPLTDVGPGWIHADAIWNGNLNGLPESRGEGTVIAILDSGINSDHPSFADIGGDGYDHTNPLGSGNYVPGSYCDVVDPSFCNDKLIGAWDMTGPADGTSPEDTDGHGSHTAGTAGGNVVVGATIGAPTTNFTRDISGVAPHANIIAYDVCIDSCPGSALIAAINQVVVDAGNVPGGIQALNYSISGDPDPWSSAVELGFLNATAAGVYVSASAGNAGPGANTVAHESPWVSTTGAFTHSRTIPNELNGLGSDGAGLADIEGLGLTAGYGPAAIVYAGDYPTANGSQNDTQPDQCLDPFPAGTWSGEIVVCDRGSIARVAKGANVLAGGAGGFVLANVDAQGESIVGDAHFLPGVHIGDSDGDVLRAWLASETGTTATISGFSLSIDPADGNIAAGFTSRGPTNNVLDVLKPDISGPGVSIMAAEANGQAVAPEYQFLSGTSMSSPHNAGSGALMSAVTNWNPYEIRSALMMTSDNTTPLKEDGMTPADHFDVGAGVLDLSRAQEAGLVLNETPANFLAADPNTGGDPKTLNIASMQDSACVGECSWTRTVTNVTGAYAKWRLTTDGPEGLRLYTTPRSAVNLGPGESMDITVKADTTLAPAGWNFANLNLRRVGDGPDLHMPIAVNAVNTSLDGVLSKTVDAATAAAGEPLNYTIRIENGPIEGQIDVVDTLPAGVRYVNGSGSVSISNGTEISPLTRSGRTLSWSGELDVGGLDVSPGAAPFGYFSLASIGVAPFGCPSNCDDGGFILNVPSFTYNGDSYSQVIWSVNGTIEAGTASGLATSASNASMPNAAAPNNLLAPFWTDLNLGAGGQWYVAVLNAGADQYTVYEWENVPLFGDLSNTYTFQIWVLNTGAGGIWYTYSSMGDTSGNRTVGAENASGSNGSEYYYNGSGTQVVAGDELAVTTQTGGVAEITFQGTIKRCRIGSDITNTVDISSAGSSGTAIAVTECVPD